MTLNIALLLDDCSLEEWQRQAVAQVLRTDEFDAEISLILINEKDTTSSTHERLHMFISKFSFWKIFVAIRIARRSINGPPWYRVQSSIEDVIDTDDVMIQSVRPKPVSSIGNVLPEDAISLVSNTDVAIRFGFGILKGDVLDAPTHGILSYHHGDMTKYRGKPPGFYEFIDNETHVGITVQQLSEKLDAGEIAATKYTNITNCESLSECRDRFFYDSSDMLERAISRIISGENIEGPETLGPVYTTPTNLQALTYVYHRLIRKCR